MSLTDLCNDIVARDEVSDDDVVALRRVVFGEVTVTAEEVEGLFRVDEGTERRVEAWRAFFLEALTDWLVRQQDPSGYVTESQAGWLIARIEADRRLRDGTEAELVVRVLEMADEAPAFLAAFGLHLATRAVVENDGVISAEEVRRMRRVVFAASGPGRLAISREEASALFDLNDAARGRANDPSWTDFFARAVANAVTACAGWAPPNRAEALRRQTWLEAPTGGVAAMLADVGRAMAGFDAERVRGAFSDPAAEHVAAHWSARETAAASAAPVDHDEARWLLDRIGRDGDVDVNERALIAFLRELAPATDVSLQPLIERLAA